MFRLVSAVFVLVLLQKGQVNATLTGSEEVYAQCRATYNEEFDNGFLIGEWFEVMRFQLIGGFVPNIECRNQVYSRANASVLLPFEEKHGVTILMGDNPMLMERDNGSLTHLIAGNAQAKLFYFDHSWPVVTSTMYNYKKLNNDHFVLWWDCAMRGFDLWLLSRTPQPTDAEIDAAIAGVEEVVRRDRTRFCAN